MPVKWKALFPVALLWNMRRLGLRGRFFTYMIILIVILMGGVFVVVEKNNRTVILLEGRKRGLSNALYLAALSTAPLLMYDYTKLEQNVDEVAKEPDVAYAMILDRKGKVIAHSRRDDLLGRTLEDPVSEAAHSSGTQLIQDSADPETGSEIWDIAYPIIHISEAPGSQPGLQPAESEARGSPDPDPSDNGPVEKWGTVRIGFSKRFLKAEIARSRRDLIILSLAAVILASGAATLLAERITGPIRKLADGALSITRGDLDTEIQIETGDEIEDLASTFNSMTKEVAKHREKQKRFIKQLASKNKQLKREISAREQLEGELIKVERLRALGEMSGGVAHDFNNILGTILGYAQLLLEKIDAPPARKQLEIIEKAALDGAETVRRIQEFTRVRADSSAFTEVDIRQVVEDSVEFTRTRWKHEAKARGIDIDVRCEFDDPPVIVGDPSGLREVFTNLIINAVDAMPKGGTIRIAARRAAPGEGDGVLVTVSDSGVGMSPEIQKRIFDPFFTTKGTRGSGLGLSICYGIVSRHKGEIRVESRIGKGTTFLITLPLGLPGRKPTPAGPPSAGELLAARVLVIDDDEVFRSVLSDTLLQSGCTIAQTGSAIEGLSFFAEGEFDLVITDLGMDEMSGWDVAARIKEQSAGTPVALITGWGAQIDEQTARERGVDFVVGKPFRLDDLRNLVHRALSMQPRKRG